MSNHYDPNQPRDDHGRWGGGNFKKFTASELSSLSSRGIKSPLTDLEKDTLRSYTSINAGINDFLRTGRAGYGIDRIKYLDEIFKKASLAEDLTVHRLIGRGPNYPKLHYHDPEVKASSLNQRIGSTVRDKGFMSTSLDLDMIKSKAAKSEAPVDIFKILVPKNHSSFVLAKGLTDHPFEQEVLLNRGSRFKVLDNFVLKAL